MAERESFLTPRVTLVYPKITKPDTYGENADGKYKTQFKFENQADSEKLQKWLRAKAKALMPKVKNAKVPFKEQQDDDGNGTGEVWFRAASKYKPFVCDGKNHPLGAEDDEGVFREMPNIGGGTIARLRLALNPYAKNKLLSLYLNEVQIIKLEEYVPAARKSSFEAADDEDAYEAEAGTSSSSSDESEDDEDSDGEGEGEAGADDFGAEDDEEAGDEPF